MCTGTPWASRYKSSLVQADSRITPYVLYRPFGQSDEARQQAYRALFRSELDADAIDDIRTALNQNQPVGNERFHAQIARMTGTRREEKSRGRPPIKCETDNAALAGQQDPGL